MTVSPRSSRAFCSVMRAARKEADMATPLQKRKLMGEINVVPYIDVMLVLLIIFMVTAPLLTQGIEVELPKVGAEPLDPEDYLDEEALVLSVDAAGNLYLNFGERSAPVSVETATEQARALLNRGPDRPVLVRADARASY